MKLYPFGSTVPIAGIREGDGPFEGTQLEEGWILIQHPRAGLVGLPLEGEHRSWQAAWHEALIDIRLFKNGAWQEPIDDWEELRAIAART